jgi:flavin-dependent dehydrogenase
VARLVGARIEHALQHGCATIYGYWRALPNTGYHWFYDVGASVGLIPTNEGNTCVFVAMPGGLLNGGAPRTLETLHWDAISKQFPSLALMLAEGERSSRLRAFAGMKGFLRQSVGPGWALVGDAGYFRDPITAHGITDALRDAELLAISVSAGDEESFARYQDTRDTLVRRLLEISDRLASFDWSLEEAKELHRALSREMKAEVEWIVALDAGVPSPVQK